jgi:copper(I)-binding protein
MMPQGMKRALTVALAPLALAACGQQAAQPAVSDAWIRLAAVPGRPAGGYFTLHGGKGDAKLEAVSVAGVPRVELHESRVAGNGATTMDAVPSVPVPAGGTVRFAPGGRHAMLFDVPATLKAGGTAPVTFRFSDGSTASAEAKVIGAGEAGPS